MARTNGSAGRGRRTTSQEGADAPQPEAPPSTRPGPGERGLRMSEMIDTEYRLLGAQLRAGRLPAAVRTSRKLTELVDSLRNIQPPSGDRATKARATTQAPKTSRPRKDTGRTGPPK